MEGGLTHLWHSFIIATIVYLLMYFVFGYSSSRSINRSLLVGSGALIYMILFGHRFPVIINSNI
jgi:VIT1/CCC1 family predicted Fe2+/Mn2+ transporter